MVNKLELIYKELNKPLLKNKKIGVFITLCSIFGGLLVAYLAMTLLVFLLPGSLGESLTIPLLLNTFAWSIASLYIAISPTKYSALKRIFIPTTILVIPVFILFLG